MFAKDKPERAEKRLTAWRMKVGGYDYDEIAQELGVSKSTVYKWVRDKLAEIQEQESHLAAEYRETELARLDRVIRTQLALSETTRNPRSSDNARAALQAMDLRVKILGIQAPTEFDVNTTQMTFADMLRLRQQRAGKREEPAG